MKNRSRTAAKVTGVVAAGALLFGAVGPASAAPQAVEYRLDTGSITFPTSGEPTVITLPTATGVVGTWDDETGAFSGTFSSEEFTSQREAATPLPPPNNVALVTQRTQILAPNPITGTIDPKTGLGSVSASFNAKIIVESAQIPPGAAPTNIGAECSISGINATYAVTATKVPADSLNFTNLSLTAAAFSVPAATCIIIATGQPAPALVTDGLNGALALPNSNVTSALTLVAGAVPPPAPTTTTTIPPTTTTTVAPVEEAPPASSVSTNARFTG